MHRIRLIILFLASTILLLTKVTPQEKLNPDSLTLILPTLTDTGKIRAYYEICKAWIGVDREKSTFAAEEALRIAEQLGDKRWIARSLNFLVSSMSNHGEYKEALPLAQRALTLAQEINYQPQILESLENCSIILSIMGHWDQTLAYARQGLQISHQIKDTIGILNNSNVIASTYQELKDYSRAESIFKESVILAEQVGRLYEKGRANANLGILYAAQFKWNESIAFARLGSDDFHKLGYPTGEAQALLTLAEAQYFLGQLDECQTTCNRILDLVAEAKNPQIEGAVYVHLALLSLERGHLTEAGGYLEIAEAQSKKVQDYLLLKKVYRTLENYSIAKQDFLNAKNYHILSEIAADSFLSENVLSRLAEYQVRYETVEKESRISAQNLIIEKEKNRKRLLIIILAFSIISMFTMLQYGSHRQKLRQKEAQIAIELEYSKTEKLRELDLLKSNFFANISHEFRTPLTLILSPVEQLIDGTLKGDLQKYYQLIYRNCLRLLELVNQLLDLSKLESGKMKFQATQKDLGKFTEAMVSSFENLAEKKMINLQVEIPDPPFVCYFDQDKVEKILTNLLSNAIKFTGEYGEVTVRLLELDSSCQKASLIISDSGMGIPKEQLSTLFDRFGLSTSSELQAGSGIGLALTKELIILHGGDIAVESEEGIGTTFRLTLTVDHTFFKASEVTTGAIETNDHPKPPSIPVQKNRLDHIFAIPIQNDSRPLVLVVEDNPEVRQYLVEQLRGNYKIEEAENGRKGYELALELIPDVIITDIMMPDIDGTQMCKNLKSNDKTNHIPVLMLTARGDMQDKLSGLATGADEYLIKPFHAAEIQLRVANLITLRKNLQQHFRSSLSLFSTTPVNDPESMDHAFLRKVRDCIETNLDDENFSVVELSRYLDMSRSQLYRKLSALIGFSPNEVIRNMRLERAKHLLEQRVGTVSEIAYLCGFNAPAYFVKCFREYFGVTPGEIWHQ